MCVFDEENEILWPTCDETKGRVSYHIAGNLRSRIKSIIRCCED